MRSMSNCAPLGAVNEVITRSTQSRSDAQKRLVSSVDVTAPALSPLAQADAVLLIEKHDGVDMFVGGDVFVGEHHAVAPNRAVRRPARPYAVEMPISVSNLRFCNRKWHLGREHGERAGEVEREEVGRGRGRSGTGMSCMRPRHSPASSRPSSLPDARSTASPVPLGSAPETSVSPLSPDSPHGQSRRDVPHATTPSTATLSWLTACE